MSCCLKPWAKYYKVTITFLWALVTAWNKECRMHELLIISGRRNRLGRAYNLI
jgi:hypothetical protein